MQSLVYRFSALFIVISSITLSCRSNHPEQNRIIPGETTQTGAVKNMNEKIDASSGMVRLNQTARFVAGLPVDSASSLYPYTQWKEWKLYEKDATALWAKFDVMAERIRDWKNKEIPRTNDSIQTLFYPFGGPDFLFANLFFPNAKTYILMGLESPGSVPSIQVSDTADMKKLLDLYKVAIEDVVKLSFFRTVDMKEELTNQTIDGTAPIIMLFLARSGKEILSVTPMTLTMEGKLIPFENNSGHKPDAVEISFMNKGENLIRRVIYLSTNLADPSLKKNTPFMKFFENLPGDNYTLIKSATYLMHKSYFSVIRNTVLNKSKLILQDASGIAYKYYNPAKWNISLYGTYVKPIEMFKDFYEPDLQEAFAKSSKPIGFRYGYDKKSSLLLARLKTR